LLSKDLESPLISNTSLTSFSLNVKSILIFLVSKAGFSILTILSSRFCILAALI